MVSPSWTRYTDLYLRSRCNPMSVPPVTPVCAIFYLSIAFETHLVQESYYRYSCRQTNTSNWVSQECEFSGENRQQNWIWMVEYSLKILFFFEFPTRFLRCQNFWSNFRTFVACQEESSGPNHTNYLALTNLRWYTLVAHHILTVTGKKEHLWENHAIEMAPCSHFGANFTIILCKNSAQESCNFLASDSIS